LNVSLKAAYFSYNVVAIIIGGENWSTCTCVTKSFFGRIVSTCHVLF
jgi:hypothetical protein